MNTDSTTPSTKSEGRSLDHGAFERAEQADEYLAALRQRVVPFKFAYVGPAAHTHDQLVRSQEYGLADVEAELIRAEFASSILPKLEDGTRLNVIDVGAGNGMKALLVLDILRDSFVGLKYVALDYSETLLQIARQNISTRLPRLDVITHRIDFEADSFAEIVKRLWTETLCPSLLLFLGHTLGNPTDRLQTLSNIGDSMGARDNLLVGIELYERAGVDEVLEHYRNEPFYRAIFNPLTFAGVMRTDGELGVSFNESSKDVEVHFELARDVRICVDASEEIFLRRGERLLIGVSHRFEEAELRELFPSAGLHIRDLVFDENRTYALVLATVIEATQELPP